MNRDLVPQVGTYLLQSLWDKVRGRDPVIFGSSDVSEDYIIRNFGFSPKNETAYISSASFSSGLTTIAIRNSKVGAAIKLNMEFCGMAPVVIEEEGREEPIPLKETKYEFLKMPNPYMRLKEIIRAISFWLDVCGEAFIYLERDGMMFPQEIHIVPPYMMALRNMGQGGEVEWYFTRPGGNRQSQMQPTIPRHKIIHLKNYGISRTYGSNYYEAFGNPIRGVSPALPILKTLATDEGVSRFLNTYTSGNTLLSGILKPAKDMRIGRRQREEIVKSIQQQILNFSDAQKMLILNAPLDFEESSFNPFDLSQKEIKDITDKEIFAIFGCNPVLLGDFDQIQSYEGIKTAEKIYYHRTIIPRLDEIKDAFNQEIFQFHDRGRYLLDFDLSKVDALDDYDIRLERATKAEALGFTPNQVNKKFKLGFTNVKWGDEPAPTFKKPPKEGMDGNKKRKMKKADSADPDEKDDTDKERKKKEE